MFTDQKTQYYLDVSSPQIHLLMQCNLNQTLLAFFFNGDGNSKI